MIKIRKLQIGELKGLFLIIITKKGSENYELCANRQKLLKFLQSPNQYGKIKQD